MDYKLNIYLFPFLRMYKVGLEEEIWQEEKVRRNRKQNFFRD